MDPEGGARRATRSDAAAVQKLRNALPREIEIRGASEADEPILAPNARAAVFEWLAEIRAREELKAVGLKPRATALLHGPPGCGKTTLAHHLGARLGIPMVMIGAENVFGSAYMGESEKGVARIFKGLEQAGVPCVVFMDEMEAWGANRSKNSRGGADNARTSILGVLLRHIEEFSGLLMAATNRPEDIDPALWRRFGMQIAIDLPEMDERFAILRRYAAPFVLSDEETDLLVDLTEGASPALLRGLMEGVKRSLVLADRLGRGGRPAAEVFGAVIAAVRPPPEMPPPPLWGRSGAAEELAALTWPLPRPAA